MLGDTKCVIARTRRECGLEFQLRENIYCAERCEAFGSSGAARESLTNVSRWTKKKTQTQIWSGKVWRRKSNAVPANSNCCFSHTT